jgi:hypothetical protein
MNTPASAAPTSSSWRKRLRFHIAPTSFICSTHAPVALLMKRHRRSDSYERFTAGSPIRSDCLTLARESVGEEPAGSATSQLDVCK